MKHRIYKYITISILGISILSAEEAENKDASSELKKEIDPAIYNYRIWTDKATNRTIKAKIIGTDKENGMVSMQLMNQKKIDLKIERLTTQNQEIILGWVAPVKKVQPIKPRDQLTITISRSGKSIGKHVDIQVIADSSNAILTGRDRYGRFVKETVKAGNTKTFAYPVADRYEFTLSDEDGNILDKESATRKTGLTHR